MMEDYLQTEWPDLNVWLTSITEQWSVIAVQGPARARVLEPLVEGDRHRPPGAARIWRRWRGRICGVPTRLFRVSFTGELGFEVNVPPTRPQWSGRRSGPRARQHGMVPYGTETMHVLRAEKGFIIVGQETDGTATPDDVGLGWAIGKAKRDFVGKRSLQRPDMSAADRKQLVGLFTADPQVVLERRVADHGRVQDNTAPVRPIGHVTSSYHSAVLGKSIALALVSGGRARMGETLYVPTGGGDIAVKVTIARVLRPRGGTPEWLTLPTPLKQAAAYPASRTPAPRSRAASPRPDNPPPAMSRSANPRPGRPPPAEPLFAALRRSPPPH